MLSIEKCKGVLYVHTCTYTLTNQIKTYFKMAFYIYKLNILPSFCKILIYCILFNYIMNSNVTGITHVYALLCGFYIYK